MKWGFGERELCGLIDSFSQREPRFTAAAPRFNGAAYWNPSANGSDTGKRRALNVGQQQHVWSQPTAGAVVMKTEQPSCVLTQRRLIVGH